MSKSSKSKINFIIVHKCKTYRVKQLMINNGNTNTDQKWPCSFAFQFQKYALQN